MDMQLFYEIFDPSLPRFSPGGDAFTRRALDILFPGKPGELKILDIGCGNGEPTMQLASCLDGTILAVDNHQPCLDELMRRAEARGLSEKIRTCRKDMREVKPDMGLFDLVWAESSLFAMGFLDGLEMCRSMLAPGGRLAVSEMCWLRPDPPQECSSYFDEVYPAMIDIETHLAAMESRGLKVRDHFILPESAWWDKLYDPLGERLEMLKKKYAGDPDRIGMIDFIRKEIDIYRKYPDYYGYVFFMMELGRV